MLLVLGILLQPLPGHLYHHLIARPYITRTGLHLECREMESNWSKRKPEDFRSTVPERKVSRGIDSEIGSDSCWIPSRRKTDDRCCNRHMSEPPCDPILPANCAVVVDYACNHKVSPRLLTQDLDLRLRQRLASRYNVSQHSSRLVKSDHADTGMFGQFIGQCALSDNFNIVDQDW